jgi:hypothetical protein
MGCRLVPRLTALLRFAPVTFSEGLAFGFTAIHDPGDGMPGRNSWTGRRVRIWRDRDG